MKQTATSTITLGPGVTVGLTEAQAKPRANVLHPVAGRTGFYLTTGHVQFKAGETFEYDDKVPKALAPVLDDEAATKAKAADAAKAKRDAGKLAKAEARVSELEGEVTQLQEELTAAAARIAELEKPKA